MVFYSCFLLGGGEGWILPKWVGEDCSEMQCEHRLNVNCHPMSVRRVEYFKLLLVLNVSFGCFLFCSSSRNSFQSYKVLN